MKTVYNNFSPYNKLQENLNGEGTQNVPSSLNSVKKQPFNREWLENYKINPKKDNIIYKNYQNNSLSKWDTEFGSLSPAQKEKYNQFLNTIPTELKGLSANEMQTYLKDISNKQNALTEEKATYDNKIQTLKTQETQRQADQKRAQEEANLAQRRDEYRKELLKRKERFIDEMRRVYIYTHRHQKRLDPRFDENFTAERDNFDSGRLASLWGNVSDPHNHYGRAISDFYNNYLSPKSFSQVTYPERDFPQGGSYHIGLAPKYRRDPQRGWVVDK